MRAFLVSLTLSGLVACGAGSNNEDLPKVACSDGVDNDGDGDGMVDFPDDPG